jgi:hypothetical protein
LKKVVRKKGYNPAQLVQVEGSIKVTDREVFGRQVEGGQFNPGHLTSVSPPDTQRARESSNSVGLSTLLKKSTFVPGSFGKLQANSCIVRSIYCNILIDLFVKGFQAL